MSRRIRLALLPIVVLAAAALVGIAATSATATFDDSTPCPRNGPILVCPSGLVGSPYSLQLQGRNGCWPYSVEWASLGGGLPPGLSLSSNGLISGTPTEAGLYTFWVELRDVAGNSCNANAYQIQYQIATNPGLSIDQQSASPGTVGVAYSEQLTATLLNTSPPPTPPGPLATATWSVDSGTLPPGITLSSSGLLSGTPTAEGTYTFVVRASLDASRSDTETETLVVRQAVTAPAVAPTRSEVGVPYTATLSATGGTGTFTWSLAGGSLPEGVTLAPTGEISGTPLAFGRFAFSAKVTDTEQRTATVNGLIVVSPKLAIQTQLLRIGKVGKLYRSKLVATGGVIPKIWKVTKGPFPHGIRLDRTTGVISGTPRKAGRYRITVEVRDGLKVVSTRTLRLTVLA